MQSHKSDHEIHSTLRRLAVEDPRRAREQFLQLLDSNPSNLDEFLRRISEPGEGRLRQIVANAVRARRDKGKIVPFLIRWHEIETDEFSARAIKAALDGVDISAHQRIEQSAPLINPVMVEAYRYTAERLNHKMRNSILEPAAHLIQLRTKVRDVADNKLRGEILSVVGELDDGLRRIERVVEAFDVDDDHFRLRPIAIADWLVSMNADYGRQFSQVKLVILGDPDNAVASQRIQACDYHLRTIFWNLWMNSQQAVSGSCEITVRLRRIAEGIELVIIDNGDGFSPETLDLAFQERYSSSATRRGQGLLEVQDAVERLHGKVGLVRYGVGQHRVRVIFPPEAE
jgi:signal transduction histidine kinase